MRERKRNRRAGCDYSYSGFYFVTSNTKWHVRWFGEIVNGKMVLNEFGQIAQKQWFWLANRYPYVVLHSFVLMPNHFRGIIEINRSVRTSSNGSTQVNSIKLKSLSELIGAYKTTSSKQIHLTGGDAFAWHRSFYDRIIRNKSELDRITEYIDLNPLNWELDEHSSVK